jgi:cell division protein ZapB
MNETTSKIDRLEKQINELLDLCKRLGNENGDLRSQLQNLSGERAHLLEQKEQVRSQVEAMITRLRSMETAS